MSGSTVHAEVKKNQHHSNIPSLLSTNFETLLRFSRNSHIAGASKLQCNVCEREFNGSSHLGKHMRTVQWAFQR